MSSCIKYQIIFNSISPTLLIIIIYLILLINYIRI
ncbi:hypothetical protein [Staphylococcus phage vB_ScaM-V1SC01]|nr:hypothetical protein [Staphylococcus phage vB_ScaM-V1SC01]WPF67528.1 hypothetical protein [Staphylococcus phage vB_SauM-V1SA12]